MDQATQQQPEQKEIIDDVEGNGVDAQGSDVPDWVVIPPDLVIPPGRVVGFLLFRAAWTDTPNKGDRQCIVWNLTDGDEKLASKRADVSEPLNFMSELSRQMIRAVDGHRADWSKKRGAGSLDEFWREIGAKCRGLVTRWYTQNHSLTQEEQADFFENCVAVRTMG